MSVELPADLACRFDVPEPADRLRPIRAVLLRGEQDGRGPTVLPVVDLERAAGEVERAGVVYQTATKWQITMTWPLYLVLAIVFGASSARNIQGTRDWMQYFRGDIMGQPYLTLFGSVGQSS